MNIFSSLPFAKGRDNVEVDADTLAQEKADRIAFHREHVRNGPVKLRSFTAGQARRAEKRRRARSQKRNRARALKAYHEEQREAMVLRGHLQAVGLLPYSSPAFKVSAAAKAQSGQWILDTFLEASNPAEAALNRWHALVGLPATRLEPGHPMAETVASS